MKTSSLIVFLALSFLTLFVAPSDCKKVKRRANRFRGSPRGSPRGKGSPKGPKPSPPSAPAPTPAFRTQTCPETCTSIAVKPFISGPLCTFANCVGLFECQNLPNVVGFLPQTGCSSYCVGYTNLQCPSGNTQFAGTPTSRCIAARCTA
jgi:hypothetical protein